MSAYIDALDNALQKGEWLILRRKVGSSPNVQNVDVRVRAAVRPVKAEEVAGAISMTDSWAVISPTQINEAQWPGGQPPTGALPRVDPRVPRQSIDQIIRTSIDNRERAISYVKPPFIVDDEIVRIEFTFVG